MKKAWKAIALIVAVATLMTSCQLFQKPTIKMEYTERSIKRFVNHLEKELGSSIWIEIVEISASSNKKKERQFYLSEKLERNPQPSVCTLNMGMMVGRTWDMN